MIWLEVRYATETVASADGVRYVVMADVINASGIARDAFVFRADDDKFMHVAMAYDMNVYPVGAGLAHAEGVDFYRGPSARVEFTSSAAAASSLRSFKARLKILLQQWRDTQTEDLGDTTVEVYTAE